MANLGRTLIIANPYSKIDKGISAVAPIEAILSKSCETDVFLTDGPDSARIKARTAHGYKTICCIGGDGTAHEVANGILERPQGERPVFALIPVGSGNDYARTLGMSISNVNRAAAEVVSGTCISIDVGRSNGEYFLGSFSCGFDADIAISTIEIRKKTNLTGLPLYMRAGFDVLQKRFGTHDVSFSYDLGDEPRKTAHFDGPCLILCATIGCTYGGGYRIAPQADPQDGMLDICIGSPMTKKHALAVFLRANRGWHTHCEGIWMFKTRHLCAHFADEPPTQIDGEQRFGTDFELGICKQALEVIVAPSSRLAKSVSTAQAAS